MPSLLDNLGPAKISFGQTCNSIDCDISLSGWPDNFGSNIRFLLSNINHINTISLFSGAGGLDIGFADAGFNIIDSVELEKNFCDTLIANQNERIVNEKQNIICNDIKFYNPTNINNVDFIIGGPPCQTFSAAGRRANGVLGITDSRGVLFTEYIRIVELLKPKGFLFENVYGITGAEKGKPWQKITSDFKNIGYNLFYRILDAADYGVPQHRERLFIIGLLDNVFKFPFPTHGPDSVDKSNYYTAKLAIESLQSLNKFNFGLNGRYGSLLDAIPPGLNYSFYTEEMGHPNPIFSWRSKFSDFLYKADPDSPVRTIKAQGGQCTGPFHWDNRRFTIDEYKRLQTFPDSYILNGNFHTQLKQIGNSVPPQLGRILALSVLEQVFNVKIPITLHYMNENIQLGFRARKHELTAIYQNKAKNAILDLQINPIADNNKNKQYTYYFSLSPNFEFVESSSDISTFMVKITHSDMLTVELYDNIKTINECNAKKLSCMIKIEPSSINWILNCKQIIGYNFSNHELSYTALWKSIEAELKKNRIKADLIQLSGYYHYNSKIKCLLHCKESSPLNFLKPVVSGLITQKFITTDFLSKLWHISHNDVFNNAIKMKKLGYEIRNTNTNPQININNWLIPYSFPTLTPQSVQLRKTLGDYHN